MYNQFKVKQNGESTQHLGMNFYVNFLGRLGKMWKVYTKVEEFKNTIPKENQYRFGLLNGKNIKSVEIHSLYNM